MTTKTFQNSFGKDIELTREEYIQRWIEQTHQFANVLGFDGTLTTLNDFQDAVRESAGKQWDKR